MVVPARRRASHPRAGQGVGVGEQELRRAVDWTVEDTPRARILTQRLGAALHVVSTVVTFGADATSGARPPTWTVPADPDEFVDIGVVRLRGRAGWLPPASSHLVGASRRAVWITPGRSQRPTHRVPVESLRVQSARPAGGAGRPRYAGASWTLTLTDGTDRTELDGAWLALAWIGALAGWPEPPPSGAG
jgi:hypothetical protein